MLTTIDIDEQKRAGNWQLTSLAEASVGGDMDAAEELIRLSHPPVVAFLYLLGARTNDIDELAQETFVVMYRRLSTYRPGEPFLPWIRGIARNVLRAHRRGLAREQRIQRGVLDQYICDWASNDDVPVDVEQVDALKRCVDGLPARQKALIQQRYFHNMGAEAIAAGMALKANAVRQALLRVRRALRRCITERVQRRSQWLTI